MRLFKFPEFPVDFLKIRIARAAGLEAIKLPRCFFGAQASFQRLLDRHGVKDERFGILQFGSLYVQ